MTARTAAAAALAASLFAPLASAQFSSGSDGSDGALTVADSETVTLDVPPDGIFNFTTVTTGRLSQINFNRNASNTAVYFLCTGDVELSGSINLQGQGITPGTVQGGLGGPGGFNGGAGHPTTPGDGLGPGGGKGGWGYLSSNGALPAGDVFRGGGSYASQSTDGGTSTTVGELYGNSLLIPLAGGSGGGGGRGAVPTGGAGGGGAICIASDTEIDCVVTAFGPPQITTAGGTSAGAYGPGSGGAIRLVAPLVKGTARLIVAPGAARGGYGRIRIDTTSPGQLVQQNGGGDFSQTYTTFGSNMVVFPPNPPSVRILEAAGQVIDESRTDPVFVLLPTGAAETQQVRVKVENFGTVVPLRATVSPESGERTVHDFSIDNTAGGATEGTVDVTIPAGTTVRIDAWTR